MEITQERCTSPDGYLVTVLNNGNYAIFSHFISLTNEGAMPLRITYSPDGEEIDRFELDHSKADIMDVARCPVNNYILINYEIEHGEHVAVNTVSNTYTVITSGTIYIHDIYDYKEIKL